MQRGFLFSVVEKYERVNECRGCLPGAEGVNLGGWDAAPCQRAREGRRRRRMLFPPSGAEQLLGKELLCSSFHQRKCQRSKLCCQMPHGHQMFPTGSHQPHSAEGRAPCLAFIPPALSSLSCCRAIRAPSWAAHRLQTGRTGAGGSRGPLATPEHKPFSSPCCPPALSPAS